MSRISIYKLDARYFKKLDATWSQTWIKAVKFCLVVLRGKIDKSMRGLWSRSPVSTRKLWLSQSPLGVVTVLQTSNMIDLCLLGDRLVPVDFKYKYMHIFLSGQEQGIALTYIHYLYISINIFNTDLYILYEIIYIYITNTLSNDWGRV